MVLLMRCVGPWSVDGFKWGQCCCWFLVRLYCLCLKTSIGRYRHWALPMGFPCMGRHSGWHSVELTVEVGTLLRWVATYRSRAPDNTTTYFFLIKPRALKIISQSRLSTINIVDDMSGCQAKSDQNVSGVSSVLLLLKHFARCLWRENLCEKIHCTMHICIIGLEQGCPIFYHTMKISQEEGRTWKVEVL